VNDSDGRLRLSPEAIKVLRHGGTEPPFSSPLNGEKREGAYHCAGCATALFESQAKFDSGCGWPSFDRVGNSDAIRYVEDNSHGMQRVEVRCASCDGHLGHVFRDGPTETGLRYCINGVAMGFEPARPS